MLYVILYFIITFPIIFYLWNCDKMKNKNKIHLYGIYGFFGLPGQGKTISMTRQLNEYRKKYGDKIYIMTNYNYLDQDFEFTDWRQLLKEYDKPLIVAWDEIQNVFASRNFKDFPIQLLTLLTQVRKGNGIQILYTSQRWHFVDKNFRSLSFGCYDCKTIMGRFTVASLFDPEDYDQKCNTVEVEKKQKIHAKVRKCFIQTKKEREAFDSYKMLLTAKSKEYMSRDELAKIESGVI